MTEIYLTISLSTHNGDDTPQVQKSPTNCDWLSRNVGKSLVWQELLWVRETDLSSTGSGTMRLLGSRSVYLSNGRAYRVGVESKPPPYKVSYGWLCQSLCRQLVKRDYNHRSFTGFGVKRWNSGEKLQCPAESPRERPPVIPRNLHGCYCIRLSRRRKCRQVLTNTSGQISAPIFKQSKTAVMDCLNVEDRNDRLSRNVGNYVRCVIYQKNEDL